MTTPDAYYASAERRIEYVTLAVGAVGAICACIFWGVQAGAGVALGAVLSWLNFRWLKQGVGTLARLSLAQAGAAKARVPPSVYFKLVGRYILLILAAYVILTRLKLSVESLLVGFGAVVVAVLAEVVAQLFRTTDIPHRDS